MNREELYQQLEKAGQRHGHICPSLFYGVFLALKVRDVLQSSLELPKEFWLEGSSQCIQDGVKTVLEEQAQVILKKNTGACGLMAVFPTAQAIRATISSEVRSRINEMNKQFSTEEFRLKGVAYLKSLPEEEIFAP